MLPRAGVSCHQATLMAVMPCRAVACTCGTSATPTHRTHPSGRGSTVLRRGWQGQAGQAGKAGLHNKHRQDLARTQHSAGHYRYYNSLHVVVTSQDCVATPPGM